ncbi:glycoside hydrolase family 2 protein [Hespellia stercorisuis]|uniref:Glycosyl hydrolases family 2 n=1 Tax=Hespellia stercorisuis DSM 15480 TaxID=1121950 RepID=A0A1M6QG07_9FIRM|nr:glycoside hydrolase family 2 [Hespellia stercorisuis]SHK19234.1 Glycosyl hydrolases family 2 [Hespellia stercorisuis DSM 15480]
MQQLYTKWGRELDGDHVLEEYPRPMLVRDSFVNLNGYWKYAFQKDSGIPLKYDGEILVPFSPETALSGVKRQLQPDEYLWYFRTFPVKKELVGRRALLHFGAVDQACQVYVNRKKAGRHTGGYLPFTVDITDYLMAGDNVLMLQVKDVSDTSWHARGKQSLKRGGMFYMAQSGIWQTVWMEYVPDNYVEKLVCTPLYDEEKIRIEVRAEIECPVRIEVSEAEVAEDAVRSEAMGDTVLSDAADDAELSEVAEDAVRSEAAGEADADKRQCIACADGLANTAIEISIPQMKSWTPETPYLYSFSVEMGGDHVESYFAMRCFTLEKDEQDTPRLCLNHQPCFQRGVLDQGYWPDGLYTAPSDEALIFDIMEMKKMGFNMMRKHLKIESERWYYHCDRLGMIVWQDMVNGGTAYKFWYVTYLATFLTRMGKSRKDGYTRLLSRRDKEGRLEFVKEMKETIELLYSHPSICTWVIFNEGWGQFQTADMTDIVRELDQTRLIDQASGWFDQGGGDMQSIHNYFFELNLLPEKERATVLSEFGGYSLRVKGHSACEKLYGYGTFKDMDSLNAEYRKRQQEAESEIPGGLCATVYTQVSDVEEEVNGIFTYDREVQKIKKPEIK